MKNYTIPDLNNVFEILKNDVYAGLRTLTIGKVLEFNKEKRTVNAQIIITPTCVQLNEKVSNREGGMEYPTLTDVPVLDCEYFSPPIHEGDYCLLIFAERNIDNWLVRDDTDLPPRDQRMHSIADAFAWFGIGNYRNSTFIAPDGYEPPAGLPEICDCPLPKYGYEQDFARFRYDKGEIDLGHDFTRNAGVVICARDYTNITMYAEGSNGDDTAGNILMFPSNSVSVNNGLVKFDVHGDSDTGYDPTNEASGVDNPPEIKIGGKISMWNPTLTKTIGTDPKKPNNWWAGKTVPISDVYRIFAQCKACLDLILDDLTALGEEHGYTPTLTIEAIMDFKNRYFSLFAPADPIEEA